MKNHTSIFIIIVLVLVLSEHSWGQNFWHGYSPDVFPPDTVVNVCEKDVIAMLFFAPVTGEIDSFFSGYLSIAGCARGPNAEVFEPRNITEVVVADMSANRKFLASDPQNAGMDAGDHGFKG